MTDGNIVQTLAERGNRYGSFTGHANVTQRLKQAMVNSDKWHILMPDQKEALEMIQHKIGRILNGDPNYHDSWHDIVGYAKLVADRILQETDNARNTHDQVRDVKSSTGRPEATGTPITTSADLTGHWSNETALKKHLGGLS